jgi:large subunit ribosomal protein L18
MIEKRKKRIMRHKRVRAKVSGTGSIPRLSVFRSTKSVNLQLVDDKLGTTIMSIKNEELKKKGTKTEIAFEAGKLLAKKALKKDIKKAIFDRGGYKYHGRVKAVAEGARAGGLKV